MKVVEQSRIEKIARNINLIFSLLMVAFSSGCVIFHPRVGIDALVNTKIFGVSTYYFFGGLAVISLAWLFLFEHHDIHNPLWGANDTEESVE
jgi:hypothetical protein